MLRTYHGFLTLVWLIVLGLFTACATAQAKPGDSTAVAQAQVPAWMTDLEKSYPDATYLAAIGSGDTRRDAESDAAASLSKIFNVNIKVDSVAQQRYVEFVSQGKNLSEMEKSVVQNVGMSANEQLKNLKYSESFTDKKGQVYMVAFLERDSTAQLYRGIIQKDAETIGKLKARAAAVSSLLQKYAMYDVAVQVSLNSDRMVGQLRIIHPATAAALASQVRTQEIMALRDQVGAKISYKIAIDGDTTGKVGGMVKAALGTIKLASSPNGLMTVTGSWSAVPEVKNKDFKSVRWTLKLDFSDESGTAVANVFRDDLANGTNDDRAQARALLDAEKFVSDELIASLNRYMNEVAQIK